MERWFPYLRVETSQEEIEVFDLIIPLLIPQDPSSCFLQSLFQMMERFL